MKRPLNFALALCSALIVLSAMPDVAYACPGCFSGNDANRVAYIVTFVILTALPLASVGGVAYWLFKRVAAAEAAEAVADADDVSPNPAG